MPVYCDEHHEAELERLSARRGRMKLGRRARDREDVPIDFRYLDPLLRFAGDPEFGLGEFLTPKTGQTGQKFFWNSLTGQSQTQRPSGN